jgi:membrane-associated phospholipid phosphatase
MMIGRIEHSAALAESLPESTVSYRIAHVLSYAINPLALPPLGFALVLWHFSATGGEIAWIFSVSTVFFCLVPLAYLLVLIRRGEVATLEVRERSRRLKPFVAGIASYMAGMALMGLTGQTLVPLMMALAVLYPLNTVIILLINLRWKISVHAASIAAFVAILLFVISTPLPDLAPAGEPALTARMVSPLLLLVPVIMWARVRVRAHTVGQVVAGAIFGLLVPLAELYLLVFHVLRLA